MSALLYYLQKMAGIVGHKMHVFAIPGHFYGSYPDGGTLGYEISLRVPAPKAEKKHERTEDSLFVFRKGGTFYGITDSPRRRHGKSVGNGDLWYWAAVWAALFGTMLGYA